MEFARLEEGAGTVGERTNASHTGSCVVVKFTVVEFGTAGRSCNHASTVIPCYIIVEYA